MTVSRETSCAPDFTGLTAAQQRVLTFQGWRPGPGSQAQPRPQTMAKLLQRGLAAEREVMFLGVRIKAYDVPLPVHMAWCRRCAELQVGAAT